MLSVGQHESPVVLAPLTDEETFLRWRWPPDGAPECPHCGAPEVYAYRCRPLWKCKLCKRQFTATSGTIFASRKMPYGEYLKILDGIKAGRPMLRITRRHQYKTVHSVAAKWRALAAE